MTMVFKGEGKEKKKRRCAEARDGTGGDGGGTSVVACTIISPFIGHTHTYIYTTLSRWSTGWHPNSVTYNIWALLRRLGRVGRVGRGAVDISTAAVGEDTGGTVVHLCQPHCCFTVCVCSSMRVCYHVMSFPLAAVYTKMIISGSKNGHLPTNLPFIVVMRLIATSFAASAAFSTSKSDPTCRQVGR